jgi:hypothetical protein
VGTIINTLEPAAAWYFIFVVYHFSPCGRKMIHEQEFILASAGPVSVVRFLLFVQKTNNKEKYSTALPQAK